MADIERSEKHCGPCPCGMGQIVIERVEISHMYGGSTSFDPTITCPKCASEYEIDDGGTSMRRKSDIAEESKRWKLADQKQQLIEQTRVAPIRTKIEAQARAQGRTKKKWYDALKAILGPAMDAQDFESFDMRVRSAGSFEGWMRNAISVRNIREVAKQVGMLDASLEHELDELAALDEAASKRAPSFPLPS